MSDPFIGEIRAFAFGRIPIGWAACDGSGIPISSNEPLYALIGTTYGGNGTTFNLPDLRGRTPLSFGQGPNQPAYVLGQKAGEETHTLIAQEMPVTAIPSPPPPTPPPLRRREPPCTWRPPPAAISTPRRRTSRAMTSWPPHRWAIPAAAGRTTT